MASGAHLEILDLRHFAAPVLRPVLEAESELWKQRLHWDYNVSARLLMQYLDSRTLPGYAALEAGQVTGFVFCIYEETKAVIGDVFALPGLRADGSSAYEVEETLLRHLLELLMNSPQVDRIESQLLLHPSGSHTGVFLDAGFQSYRRLLMMRTLDGYFAAPRVHLPVRLELRPWRDEDLPAAAQLISAAYRGHPDSVVNDQYRTVHGSLRFLNNIVRFSGCGVFSPHGLACGDRSHQPGDGGAGAGLARQPRERPHHPALRPSRVSPPRPGPQPDQPGRFLLPAPGRQRNLAHRHRSQHRCHRPLPRRGLRLRAQLRRHRLAAESNGLKAIRKRRIGAARSSIILMV